MNNITQYTQTPDNLFALLSKYRVIIPGIQRHYVQGADNPKAEEVRKSFIQSLLNGQDMQLHFVYGPINYEDEDAFIPVDGQQRLTTLWLLARYAAEKLDNAQQKNDILKLLVRFSYADRMHATRFCKALCSNSWNTENNPKADIPKQPWFFDYWKEDETVASMLRMLFTIHQEWEKKSIDPNTILDALVNNIKFSLRIDSFGDDIYMKMNARGLQLTQWENFKAKFADKLSKDVKTTWDKEIERLSNLYFEVANNRLPDDAFFTLMGRVCYYLSGGDKKKYNNLDKLASAELSKSPIPYVSFEEFIETLKDKSIDDFAIQYLNLIELILNKAKDEKVYLCSPYWDKKSIIETFFNSTTDNERDFTLCCFEYVKAFPNAEYVAFSQAYRFMWNILENVWRSSDNPYNRIGYVKEQLDSNDPSLYPANEDWLHSKLAEANTPSQLIEEWQKALQMHAPNQDKPINWVGDWQNWQTAIEQAESYAFFKGSIRFLFPHDANGNADWSQFDTKFENTKKYFDENGVQDRENIKYATDAILVKAVLSRCTKNKFWKSVWWRGTIFNNRADTWKGLLCDNEWRNAIHEILIGNLEVQHNDIDCLNKMCHDDGLLKFVANGDYHRSWIRNAGYREYNALWVPRYSKYKIILNMITREWHRDGIITFHKDQEIPNSHFVKGEDICFVYNNHFFIWYSNNTICLMNNNWKRKYSENAYYFPVDNMSADEIITELNTLIQQANQSPSNN